MIAIESKNPAAMFNLGLHYENNKDYDNMLKYYLMAAEYKDRDAVFNLGYYYGQQKDHDNMVKYYLMAVEYKSADAMYNLGYYYKQEKDRPNMLKYYLMAIEYKNKNAMYNLGCYYKEENDYENMIKYYLMAIENGELKVMNDLVLYYQVCHMEHCGLIIFHNLYKKGIPQADIKLRNLLRYASDKTVSQYLEYVRNIDIESDKLKTENTDLKSYVTELELAPEGPKYKEAKEHFESICNTNIN
jgi:tetratricopeptide (TPR) repeat protein